VSRSILGMPTFYEPCSSLHQCEEQPETELFLRVIPLLYITLVGVAMGSPISPVIANIFLLRKRPSEKHSKNQKFGSVM